MIINDKDKQIIFIKSYFPIEKDTRIMKETSTLKNNGYKIKYICWNKNIIKDNEKNTINKDKHVFSLNSVFNKINYNNPIISYLVLPLWWMFIIRILLKEKWDAIHVINFTSILPSLIIAKIKQKPIIYEIEDTFFDHIKLPHQI